MSQLFSGLSRPQWRARGATIVTNKHLFLRLSKAIGLILQLGLAQPQELFTLEPASVTF